MSRFSGSLRAAAEADDTDRMLEILDAGRVAPVAIIRAVRFAAKGGALRALHLLHERGADLDLGSATDGATATGIAANNGQTASIKLLAELRADLHKPRTDGARPLDAAAQHDHVDAAKLLLQLRADVNAQDNAGRTACWSAACDGHDRVIRLLISARASFIADNFGTSPVFVAAELGHDRVIVTLARARASIDEHQMDGCTPIAMAANQKQADVVRLLAHLGARLRLPDGRGFWLFYQDDDPRQHEMQQFWPRIVDAGGDEPTQESRRLRCELFRREDYLHPRAPAWELRYTVITTAKLLNEGRAHPADTLIPRDLGVVFTRRLPSDVRRYLLEEFV